MEGGTQLTIFGENFGWTDITKMVGDERINAWVGERKCSVTQRGFTRIQCTIENATMWDRNEEYDDMNQLAQIRVEAFDSIFPLDMKLAALPKVSKNSNSTRLSSKAFIPLLAQSLVALFFYCWAQISILTVRPKCALALAISAMW